MAAKEAQSQGGGGGGAHGTFRVRLPSRGGKDGRAGGGLKRRVREKVCGGKEG
jgi:hypothetical protein